MAGNCNLNQTITPNHFDVRDFEPFDGLAPDQEFALVAAVFIYHDTDVRLKSRAQQAYRQLKRLGHPLAGGSNVDTDVDVGDFRGRYNALMMVIAEREVPDIESYIDKYGAFSFRVPGDESVLCGDASRTFAYYLDAESVRERLQHALAFA